MKYPSSEAAPVSVSLAHPVLAIALNRCVADAADAPPTAPWSSRSHAHQWMGDGYQVGQFWDELHAVYQRISWDWALVAHSSNLFNNAPSRS